MGNLFNLTTHTHTHPTYIRQELSDVQNRSHGDKTECALIKQRVLVMQILVVYLRGGVLLQL